MEIEEYCIMVSKQGGSYSRCCPIDICTTFRCKEDVLNKMLSDEDLNKDFELNIVRLNRWWWSVSLVPRKKETWEIFMREA